MGLLDGLMGNASRIDASKIQHDFAQIRSPGEKVEHAYRLIRDSMSVFKWKAIGLTIAAILPLSSQAAWDLLVTDSAGRLEIDSSTLRRTNGFPSVRTKANFNKLEGSRKYLSLLAEVEFDCGKRSSRYVNLEAYSGNDGEGSLVGKAATTEWSPIKDASVLKYLESVCGTRATNADSGSNEASPNPAPATIAIPRSSGATTPKAEFLQAASAGGAWWKEWGHDRYGGGFADTSLIRKSAVIRQILEREGVSVPFNEGRLSAAKGMQIREKANVGSPVSELRSPMTWCETLTPIDLSSGVAATTAVIAPELAFPGLSAQNVRRNAQEYLQYMFRGLESYCSRLDGGRFVQAYKQFLDEYAGAIRPVYERELQQIRLAEEKLQKQQQEEEQRKMLIAQAKEAELKAEKEKKEAERQRVAKVAEEKAEADRRAYLAALEEQKRNDEARKANLKSGAMKPASFKDVSILYDAKNGDSIVSSPPVNPDKLVYAVAGRLERKEGEVLVFKWTGYSGDIRYFVVKMSSSTINDQGFSLRFEYPASVLGRFVGTTSYTTVGGQQKEMPVFEGLALGPFRR